MSHNVFVFFRQQCQTVQDRMCSTKYEPQCQQGSEKKCDTVTETVNEQVEEKKYPLEDIRLLTLGSISTEVRDCERAEVLDHKRAAVHNGPGADLHTAAGQQFGQRMKS